MADLQPYRFEPERVFFFLNSEDSESENEEVNDRLEDTFWCSCSDVKSCQRKENVFVAENSQRKKTRHLSFIFISGPVYTGLEKSFHEQKLAKFHFAFTQDRRNWTNFWTAKSASSFLLFPGPKLAHLASRSKIRRDPPVPCKRKVELCRILSVQKFVGTWVNGICHVIAISIGLCVVRQ